jgi:integrase
MSNYRFYTYIEKRKVSGKVRRQNVPIMLRFTYGKKRLVLATGLKGNIDQWSAKDQRFKSSAANAAEKNLKLKHLRDHIENIYLNAEHVGMAITNDMIKNDLRGKSKGAFLDLYDEFVLSEATKKGLAERTITLFETMRRRLVKMSDAGIPLNFQDVSHDWYMKVWNYSIDKGHTNSTALQYLAELNWFFRWCRSAKKIDVPQVDFKPRDPAAISKKPENLIYLRPDEFLRLLAFEPNTEAETIAKDTFIFLCTSGLRISDLRRLKSHHVSSDEITIRTQKTSESIAIPLNIYSRKIIQKYKDHYMVENDEVLPYIPLLRLNMTLRDVAKAAGLDRIISRVTTKGGKPVPQDKPLHEIISSHAGRRTFISLSIALNINSHILMSFTGHTKPETLKHYIGIGKDVQRKAMDNFSSKRLLKIV